MTFFQTFRFRLTLQYALVLGLFLCLFSVGVYLGLWVLLYRNLDASLWSIAEAEVASASDAPDGTMHFHDVEPNPLLARQAVRLDKLVQLRTFPHGQLLGKSHNLGALELPLSAFAQAQLARGGVVFETVRTSSSPAIRLISLPIIVDRQVRYVMQVGASLLSLHTTLTRLFWLLLIMDGSALVLTSIAGAFLAHRALRPLDRLVRTIERIASQNLHQRLTMHNPNDEFGRLTRVLNHMLERLEGSFRSQQRFVADASHELRSPLANLQLALELAIRRPRTPEDYRQALQSALEDVHRVAGLVNDLLTLSRADSGHFETVHKPVPLQALLEQLLTDYQLQATEHGLGLTFSMPEVVVRGDALQLRQLFANLLDNALRATPPPGKIRVSGGRQLETVWVAVTDTGIGIAPEHLPHIFDRFYRADPERARDAGGGGLGLAICQEIVRAHAGSLSVESAVGQGSTFTVILPLDQSESRT
jgi:heavy metal sensor kinase